MKALLILPLLVISVSVLATQTKTYKGYIMSADEISAPKVSKTDVSAIESFFFLRGHASVKGDPTFECSESITLDPNRLMTGIGACTATTAGKKFSGTNMYLTKVSGHWQILKEKLPATN